MGLQGVAKVVDQYLCGRPETGAGTKTIAIAMDMPLPSTPSPSARHQNQGTFPGTQRRAPQP